MAHTNLKSEFLLYSFSTVAYQASSLAMVLLMAKLLGPEIYGLWSVLALVILYGRYLHLGAHNIMGRDIPVYKGRNNIQKVREISGVSLGVSLLVPVLAGLLIAFVSEVFFGSDKLLRTALKLTAVYLCLQMLLQYSQDYLKANCRFDKLSIQLLLLSVVVPVVTVPLILLYSLNGMILGQCISLLVVLVITMRLFHFSYNADFSPDKIYSMIKTGFPIMLLGIVYILFNTVDRWVIIKFLNMKELGYYSLANKAFSSVLLLTYVVGDQMYPRMAGKYGETGNSVSLTPLILKQISMTTAILIPVGIVLYFLFPFVIRLFLPDFSPAISTMSIFLVGLFFSSPVIAFGNFFVIIGKHFYYLGIMVLCVFVNLVLNILFVKLGLGIKGVALGVVTTYFLFTFALMALWYLNRKIPFPLRSDLVSQSNDVITCLK